MDKYETMRTEGDIEKTQWLRVRLEDGREAWVPEGLIVFGRPRGTGSTEGAEATSAELRRSGIEMRREDDAIVAVMPVVEEALKVEKHVVERTRARIHKTVSQREEDVELPLQHEDVEIKRVPVNRRVDGPVPIHRTGDTTIIPLMEEVVVLEKHLVLREELHISKRRTTEVETQHVVLRREEVRVEDVADVEGKQRGPFDGQADIPRDSRGGGRDDG